MIQLYQLAFETSKIKYAFTYMVQKSAPSHLMKFGFSVDTNPSSPVQFRKLNWNKN